MLTLVSKVRIMFKKSDLTNGACVVLLWRMHCLFRACVIDEDAYLGKRKWNHAGNRGRNSCSLNHRLMHAKFFVEAIANDA